MISIGVSVGSNMAVRTHQHYAFEAARAAWECGDFERCVFLCADAVDAGDVDDRVVLLKVRALQRLLQWHASAATLAEARFRHVRSEPAVHARILKVRAETKLGNLAAADRALIEVRDDALSRSHDGAV